MNNEFICFRLTPEHQKKRAALTKFQNSFLSNSFSQKCVVQKLIRKRKKKFRQNRGANFLPISKHSNKIIPVQNLLLLKNLAQNVRS